MMPNRDALSGTSIVVWGNTTAGAGTQYTFKFGDGTPDVIGNVAAGSSSYIAVDHVYSTALPQATYTTTLIIGSSSATVNVKVTNPTATVPALTPEQVQELKTNLAIEDGLRFLYYSVQNREATHTGGWNSVKWFAPHGSDGSFTSMALLSFENHGYLPTGSSIYAPLVQGGLKYLFGLLQPIDLQCGGPGESAGNPCVGVSFDAHKGLYAPAAGPIGYSTAVVMLAIVGSGATQAFTATNGDATYVNGQTYLSIVQRLSNAVVWGQADGDNSCCWWLPPGNPTNRGGWQYGLDNHASDGSAVGWNVLALLDATGYGATIPAHAKTELAHVIAGTSAADGGMGYSNPTHIPNTAKAGIRLESLNYMGVGLGASPPVGGPTPQKTVDYINTYWNDNAGNGNNTYHCPNSTLNKGCIYAMYNVFKGLKLYGVSTLSNVTRPDDDWHKDYRDFLVANQISPNTTTGGSWNWPSIAFSAHIADEPTGITTLALLILSPTALTLPTNLTLVPNGSHLFGQNHTLTATATGGSGVGINGVSVTFEVVSGPSGAGTVLGSATTAGAGTAAGMASLTYTYGGPTVGTDVVKARIGNAITSNTVNVDWKSPNSPPNVTNAAPSSSCLWPPNHQFVGITIGGVTDPDGNPVTITVNGVTSDERTTAASAGGGVHAPDASGVGSSTAQLRAERAGTGDGRVYEISFTASDGNGGSTPGKVQVKVPHDVRRNTCEAVNSGQIYDATAIN